MPTNPNADAVMTETMDQLHMMLDPMKDHGILSGAAYKKIHQEASEFFEQLGRIIRYNGTEEAYWERFQSLFGFANATEIFTPMNAANLCPEPTGLLNAINLLRAEYNKNVAQQTRMVRGIRVEQLERARKVLADGLNCEPNNLAIVRNASEGNNAVSCGYRHWLRTDEPSKRQNVVLWSENHPTNLTAWRLRAEWDRSRDGNIPPLFEVRLISFTKEEFKDDDRILAKFKANIDRNTRFVSFSETSNGSGSRISMAVIKGIWEHAESFPECHIHIDGTMAWGAADPKTDLPLSYCHSFVSSAHKWFLGPKETGILYMHPRKVENFAPSIYAYDYKIEIKEKWDEMPKSALRFELLGQRDDVHVIALWWTQLLWDILASRPDRHPAKRVSSLAQYLKTELKETSWEIRTPEDERRSRGVVRVEAPRVNDKKESLYEWMYDPKNQVRVAGSGGGAALKEETFRLCPHIYNTRADVDRAINGMNKWRRL